MPRTPPRSAASSGIARCNLSCIDRRGRQRAVARGPSKTACNCHSLPVSLTARPTSAVLASASTPCRVVVCRKPPFNATEDLISKHFASAREAKGGQAHARSRERAAARFVLRRDGQRRRRSEGDL